MQLGYKIGFAFAINCFIDVCAFAKNKFHSSPKGIPFLFSLHSYLFNETKALRKVKSEKQIEKRTKETTPFCRKLSFLLAEEKGFEPLHPVTGLRDFESFPPCDFWWKLSEDGSTQRKPKSCGILRILASVFRFYLNPPDFPSSSRFCPEL